MMQFLQKALEKKTEGRSLIALLEKTLAGWEKGRSYKTIHASMLTDSKAFCPREVALLDILKKEPKDSWMSVARQVCHDQGNALHERARNHWFKEHAVGNWHCGICGHFMPFQKKPTWICTGCGLSASVRLWKYEEPVFKSKSTGISGSMDMFIDFGAHQGLTLTEIKTEDKDSFKTLKGPKGEHRARTCLYLWVIRDSGSPVLDQIDTTRAKVLYISKAFGTKGEDGKILPVKEFWVEYDAEAAAPYVQQALAIKKWREDNATGIPAGICATSFVSRVKQCSCAQECWSGKYQSI